MRTTNVRTFHTIDGLAQHPNTKLQGYRRIVQAVNRCLFRWDDAYPDIEFAFKTWPATAEDYITLVLAPDNQAAAQMWDQITGDMTWRLLEEGITCFFQPSGDLFVASREEWVDA